MSKPVRSLAALLLLVGLSCALALPAAALFGRSKEEPPAPAGAPVAEAFTLITYRDVAVTANFSATDPQGDPVTFRVTKEPARGRIDFASEGSAAFTYVPYEGKTGKDSFTFVAEDPSGNVSRPVTVKVRIVKPRTAVTYADLTGHPAQKAAIALAERGLFVGERLGETWFFRPDAAVSRAEFLALAMDAVGHDDRPEVERTGFADDDAVAAWARPYVAGALRTGAVQGRATRPAGAEFAPAATITRAEAVVLLDRLLPADPVPCGAPEDGPDAPVWARQSAVDLTEAGVLWPGEDLSAGLTRADAATLLLRALEAQGL